MRRLLALLLALCLAFPPLPARADGAASPGMARTAVDAINPDARNNLGIDITCGGVDDTTALANALASAAKFVRLHYTTGGCVSTATLTPQGGQTIEFVGSKGTLALNSGSVSRILDLTGLSKVTLRNMVLDGTSAAAGGDFVRFSGTTDSQFEHVDLTNAPGSSGAGAIVFLSGSQRNTVWGGKSSGSGGNAAFIFNGSTTQYNKIIGHDNLSAANFGVRAINGASHNEVLGGSISSSGLEAIAFSLGTSYNKAQAVDLSLAGDNCISVVGDHNIIVGNTGKSCQKAGIYLWGSENILAGNTLVDNNLINDSNHWPCIGGNGDFGAWAQDNNVGANLCDDDQVTPTQYGIVWKGHNYTFWQTGQAVTSGAFWFYAGNVYVAAGSGTTGATPPACTSGTCSDGTITWTFQSAIIADGVAVTAWTAGMSVTAATNYVSYGPSLYRPAGTGTAGSAPPTCQSGTCSDGAVTWTYISPLGGNINAGNNVVRFAGSAAYSDTGNFQRNTLVSHSINQFAAPHLVKGGGVDSVSYTSVGSVFLRNQTGANEGVVCDLFGASDICQLAVGYGAALKGYLRYTISTGLWAMLVNGTDSYHWSTTAFVPTANNTIAAGSSGARWSTVFGVTGDFTNFTANGTAGVNCASGVTAGTVTVVNGIVTHC